MCQHFPRGDWRLAVEDVGAPVLSRKPHDFNDLISNVERVVGELHAKLVLKVITRQVSVQDVEEAGILHGGVRVFRSGFWDEATEGRH